MQALARTIHRRRRLVLAVTLVVVAAAGAYGGPVVGLLDTDDDFEDPSSESVVARATVERVTGRSASPDMVVLVRLGAPVDSRPARQKIARVAAALEDPDVAQVVAVRRGEPAELVSRDRRSTYLLATFAAGADEDATAERLQVQVEREPGVTAGGGQLAFTQVGEQVQEDLARAEALAFPLLFLLSLVVFRGAVAALLPVIVGATTILLTFALLRIANTVEPMSVFAINLITGAGLGLAIDYSLFVVSRFREELEGGSGTAAALAATMRTAGRTVLFSAVTVAAAMAALIAFDLRFLFSMGVGGTLVALSAALVSLTVLPALLAVLGPRVNALSLKRWQVAMHRDAAHVRAGPWYRLTQTVMRRPGPIAAATAVLLIAMGLPFLRIEFTGVDAGVLPTERSARVVDDALETEFPRGPTAPIIVLAGAGERGRAAATGYARDLSRLDGVASVGQPEQAGGYWRIDVVPSGDALSASAKRLVKDIRGSPPPFPVQVTGGTAGFLDQQSSLGDSLPLGLILLLHQHARDPVPDDGLGRAAGQGADHEPAHAQRRVRPAGADLPGRPAGGAARVRCPGRAGVHPADPAVRRRLRALDRLRRVPADAHQGGARRRGERPRGGRRSGSSARAGSSPTRRCCSASRSARSPRPRWCSSRSSGSAPRSPC